MSRLKVHIGIESVLSESSEIRYFYMDTKNDLAGANQKAKEAFALYRKLDP